MTLPRHWACLKCGAAVHDSGLAEWPAHCAAPMTVLDGSSGWRAQLQVIRDRLEAERRAEEAHVAGWGRPDPGGLVKYVPMRRVAPRGGCSVGEYLEAKRHGHRDPRCPVCAETHWPWCREIPIRVRRQR